MICLSRLARHYRSIPVVLLPKEFAGIFPLKVLPSCVSTIRISSEGRGRSSDDFHLPLGAARSKSSCPHPNILKKALMEKLAARGDTGGGLAKRLLRNRLVAWTEMFCRVAQALRNFKKPQVGANRDTDIASHLGAPPPVKIMEG